MAFGTLGVLDDLWTEEGTIAAANEAQVAVRFAEALAIHNRITADMLSDFGYVTPKFLLPYGGTDDFQIQEVDEYGEADASKVSATGNLGLPLRQYSGVLQWTRTYLETHSVSRLAKQLDAAATADIKNLRLLIRKPLFNPTNNDTYKDVNMTGLTLPLKALLNADGMAIPVGPNGQTFDGSTHTHYLANSTLTAAALLGALDTVIEHGLDGSPRIYIARADEEAVRALAGFTAYVDTRVVQALDTSYAKGALDMFNPDNRAIGLFQGAEVWVKPWMIASYHLVFDRATGENQPLGIRTRTGSLTGLGAWGMIYEFDEHPLRAKSMFREIGIGVVNRHKAAVLYSGGSTYATPAGL